MATYEYKCPICKDITEHHSPDGLWCELGHEEVEMHRVYSIGGIHFKGRGFFKTDNKEK